MEIVKKITIERITIEEPMGEDIARDYIYSHGYRTVRSGPKRNVIGWVDYNVFQIVGEKSK